MYAKYSINFVCSGYSRTLVPQIVLYMFLNDYQCVPQICVQNCQNGKLKMCLIINVSTLLGIYFIV